MQNKEETLQGWMFSAGVLGYDAWEANTQEYIDKVQNAIDQFEDSINNHPYRNLGAKQLQGFMFEEWAVHTYNINAAAAGTNDYAEALHSNDRFSVDIRLHADGSIKDYSAKSYFSAEQTAKEQALFDPESGKAGYYGQGRLVPSDQLQGAKNAATIQSIKNQYARPAVAEAYLETEKELTDIISNDKRVSSNVISRRELETIAKESKNQKFNAAEHDVTLSSAIKPQDMLKEALKAGYTTATVTIAFQLAPEIYKSIDYLIKNGEIDILQIKKMGEKGISAGASGFLRGAVSSSLFIMCKQGAFGEALKNINPALLGTITALVMQTVKNSIMVAAGKMTYRQMGDAFADTVVISGGYLAGTKLGGFIGQALGLELPVAGYLLGSLIGAAFCVVYNIGKKKLISFCVDSGFTCFGLVEQNYELPDEVLNELGIETVTIPRIKIEKIDIPRVNISYMQIPTTEYETIDIQFLRRGVIGVNKIGYVLG